MDLGGQIKELRKQNDMTLRQLADKCGLSTGFLSQLERGLTTISVDSLQAITKVLGVEPGYFFRQDAFGLKETDEVVRSYELTVSFSESDRFIHQYLVRNPGAHHVFPEIILLMPEENPGERKEQNFRHKGEEFIYVLEGLLTLKHDHKTHKLYPGDSFLFESRVPHSWYNSTNQITKILVVRYPNPFLSPEEKKK